jgi:hypothetical protein
MDEKQIEQVRPVLKVNHIPLRLIDRSNMSKKINSMDDTARDPTG